MGEHSRSRGAFTTPIGSGSIALLRALAKDARLRIIERATAEGKPRKLLALQKS
jgi:hypothetical protein